MRLLASTGLAILGAAASVEAQPSIPHFDFSFSNQGDFGTTDLTHLSAGIGIAARSYQIDLAADFSDEVDTTSLSFIYTF